MPPTSSLPTWLTHAFEALQREDIAGWMEIYSPDAIHEFPFAPVGAVRRLEGLEAISAYMNKLPGHIRFGSFSDLRVREVGDELIIEATGHHHRISDGNPIEIHYVWFITLRDGKVTRIRDYMSPQQL